MAETGQIRAGVVRAVIRFVDGTQTTVGSLLAHYDAHMQAVSEDDELVLYTLDAKRIVDMLEDAGADAETVDRVLLGLEAAALDSEANDEDDYQDFWYDDQARDTLVAVLACHRRLPSGACSCGASSEPGYEVHVVDVFEEAMRP